MEMIIAEKTGKEIGELTEALDMDIGKENDFEINVPISKWSEIKFNYGNKIFVPGTEFGGVIEEWNSGKREIKIKGITWRGLLNKAIVEPQKGESYFVLNGELNNCIGMLLGSHFGSLFRASKEDTGISITSWKVERYCRLGEELEKLLKSNNQKLTIRYIQPKNIEYGFVELKATPIKNLTEEIEYSKEGSAGISVKDDRGGINHLICTGKGENEERVVLHLYVDKSGHIVKEKSYIGEEEREDLYEYNSADLKTLEENGIKRLEELKNKKIANITEVKDSNADIGDIISGYDQITKTSVKKAISSKILKGKNGEFELEYKIEEGEKNGKH